MQRTLKRLALTALLGLLLTLGVTQTPQAAQHHAPLQVADPIGGTTGGG